MSQSKPTQTPPPEPAVPAFIDIEASGFGSRSYPVEVGLAMPDTNRYCALIRPEPGWEHWDSQAERIHGINRELLVNNGRDAQQVCYELNALLSGTTVFSDGWTVDFPWLRTLFTAGQTPMKFQVSSLEFLLSETQLLQWDATKTQVIQGCSETRHRASNDAALVQKTYCALLEGETS